MITLTVTIDVGLEKTCGVFVSKSELCEALAEVIDNPGELGGLGFNGDSEYVISDWNVEVS